MAWHIEKEEARPYWTDGDYELEWDKQGHRYVEARQGFDKEALGAHHK